MHKPNDFWKAYIARFWYFDVQYVSGANYSFVSGLWQNSVTAPYCRDWEPRYSQTHPSASDFHEYHSDTPRHPPDIPQTPTRHLQGAGDANRRQQTPTDTARCTQTALVSVFGCLELSVCVWWCLLLSVGISCSLEMSVGCVGDVWWVFGGARGIFMEIGGTWMCLGLSGFSVPAVWSCNTILSQPWNQRIVCTWDILDIKIPKPPHIRFPKIIGFVQFLIFWFRQRNITIHSLFGSPCTMPYHNIQWGDMQYTAIISNTIQYHAMRYNTLKCHAIHCNAIK